MSQDDYPDPAEVESYRGLSAADQVDQLGDLAEFGLVTLAYLDHQLRTAAAVLDGLGPLVADAPGLTLEVARARAKFASIAVQAGAIRREDRARRRRDRRDRDNPSVDITNRA